MPRFTLKASSRCSGIQGIHAPLTGGSISSSGHSDIQGIYDQLTRGYICLLYIYMQCSGIQGIYA